jgi:hypothetical protein
MYRKPTQTDITVTNSSCDPYEHKLSGIKYLLNWLHTYPKTKRSKQMENPCKTYYRKMNITQTYLRNHCHNHKNKACTKTPSTTKQNGPLLLIVERQLGEQEECSVLDIKNIFTPSEVTTVILDIQIIY